MMTHNQRRAQWSAERHGQALERLRILDDIEAVETSLRFAGPESAILATQLSELRTQLLELDV